MGRATATSVLVSLLPSADSLAGTTMALREQIGWIVHRLRGWIR